MAMFAEDIPSKWTIYIDSGEASDSFVKCVHENGDFEMIEELWTLIKEFMIMSDEQMRFCRRVSASQNCVVVRDGVIVPCLYFTNIFNRRALKKLYLFNQITFNQSIRLYHHHQFSSTILFILSFHFTHLFFHLYFFCFKPSCYLVITLKAK